jgi:catechol 2,3-dioxygenase-like lactoylglutathione lyase family enzyme
MVMDDTRDAHGDQWAALVPELLVTDLNRSLAFYIDGCGFRLRFARPEDGFAYLALGDAQIMLEQASADSWITGPLTPPLGRGINFQIEVEDIAGLEDRVVALGTPLFRPPMTEWYRVGDVEHCQTQFLIQDPDGYLLRCMQHLGERPVSQAPSAGDAA